MSNDKNATPKVFEHPAGFKLHPVAWGNDSRTVHVSGFITEGFDALTGKEIALRVPSMVCLGKKLVNLPAVLTAEILAEMVKLIMADTSPFQVATEMDEFKFLAMRFPEDSRLGAIGATAEFSVIPMKELKKHGALEESFEANFRPSPRYKKDEMFDFVVINMNLINQALYYEVKVNKDGYTAIVEIEDGKTIRQYKAGDSRQARRGWKDLDETFSIFIETNLAWVCWKGLFAEDDIPKFLGWKGNEKLQSHNDEFGSVTLSNIRREDDRPVWRPQGPRGPGSMPSRGALPFGVMLDDAGRTSMSAPNASSSAVLASKHIVNPDPSLILPSSGISDTSSIPD